MTPLPAWKTLVAAEELAPRLGSDGLVVVDTRASLADPGAGEAAWRAAHLPGARHAHLDRDLSGAHSPGAGRHPWPDAATFARRLGALGITPTHQVVAYDDGEGAYAARLWWLLRIAGHARVAVLDGGWARWRALGFPVESDLPVVAAAGGYPVRFDGARLLDPDGVQAHLAHGGLLIDARAGERFRGEVEPIDAKAGHVPGAASRPYAANLDDGCFKPAARLAAEFGALLGARPATEVAVMCGSGVTACHHLLAMAHAGLDGAKLFTGSWSGWIEAPGRPVATGGA